MKLLITHEIHAVEVEGRFYNQEKAVIGYNALCNYRYLIKDIVVVGRSRRADSVSGNWLRLDGEGISVCPIPELNFNSPIKVLFSIPRAIKQGLRAISSCDRYMVRLPGPTGVLIALLLRLKGKRYGVELAGDPIGMFQLGEKLVKFQSIYSLFNGVLYKSLIRNACAVAYRSNYLRKLYPNKERTNEWVFSGVQITPELIGRPKPAEWFKRLPIVIMFVGRISKGKGLIELLNAFKRLSKHFSTPMELHFVGDGEFLVEVKAKTEELGLSEKVVFHGRIPWGDKLFAVLDCAHCFVLPTYSEGMPRSLLEAMARGLPCFGSDIEVIKEVLDEDLTFKARDSDAIYEKLCSVLLDPAKLAEISARCFNLAKRYYPESLAVSKTGFWNKVMTG